jgi:hypothetical protein
LARLDQKVKKLKAGDNVEHLTQELVDYQTMMIPHLEQEEAEYLPLCRAYFTPTEMSLQVRDMMTRAPPVETGSFVKCMGIDRFRNEFIPQEKIPWFVWYVAFRGRVKVFEQRYEMPMQKLMNSEL